MGVRQYWECECGIRWRFIFGNSSAVRLRGRRILSFSCLLGIDSQALPRRSCLVGGALSALPPAGLALPALSGKPRLVGLAYSGVTCLLGRCRHGVASSALPAFSDLTQSLASSALPCWCRLVSVASSVLLLGIASSALNHRLALSALHIFRLASSALPI